MSIGSLEHPRLRPVEVFPVEMEGRRVICLKDPEGLAEGMLMVPPELVPILALLDGRRTLMDIQAEFAQGNGTILPGQQLRDIVRQLDESLFMEGDRISAHRQSVLEAFRKAPERPAAHAGQSYEADPEALRASIDSFFDPPDGPGKPARGSRAGELRGVIAPHIDLRCGGACFAWAYREVSEASDADLFIVFGTGHSVARGPYALTGKDYATPFGPARTDRRFLDALVARSREDLYAEELGHRTEHSIEFQAVFLKYLYPDQEVSIVPVLCGSFHEMLAGRVSPMENAGVRDFVEALRETIAQDGRRICMVAGVDFAHVGTKFGDPGPMSAEFLETVEAEDRERIAALEALDSEAFYGTISRDGDRRRICGTSSIYTMLRVMEASRGKLLRYDRNVDPRTDSAVTFASMAFY